MSTGRRKFTTEVKVEAAHRVIDSGRSIVEVARELSLREDALVRSFVILGPGLGR